MQRETKLILETVRGKAKPKAKTTDKGESSMLNVRSTAFNSALHTLYVGSSGQDSSNSKSNKDSKRKITGPSHSASLSLLPLSSSNKYTVEVLDDDAPDATPREGVDEDALQREKLKRAQLAKLEKRYRNLTFSEEARRVRSRQDIFV
ncbi:hypothetical protein EON65_52615, partial [archaeon]